MPGCLLRCLALAAAVGLAPPAARAQAPRTLTVCTEAAPEGFDIVQYEAMVTADAAGLPLFDTLVRFEPGGTRIVPGLAEAWDVSADGLAYTFTLRQGVKFHSTPWFKPTRELDADDVLWSIQRMLDPRHPAHGAGRGAYAVWAGLGMASLIQAVHKVDARAVRFTLSRPNAAFLANLAIPFVGSIGSAEYGQQLVRAGQLDRLNTQPVGTGPFVFRSYQKDALVRYDAFTDHWAGRPAVDRMVFAVTVDSDVRTQRAKAGECLVAQAVKPQHVATFDPAGPVQVVRSTPLATLFLTLNTRRRPLDDVRLRRALWLALDKPSQLQAVYGGFGVPAVSVLPPSMWGHDSTLKDRADPQQARALVKASGYDGRELQLFGAPGGNRKQALELLQADFARIGVKAAVRLVELGELLQRTARGEHDMVLLGWYSDNGDPDNFLSPNFSCAAVAGGGNRSRWCDPRLDAMLDAALKTTDPARRTGLYVQAQRIIWDEVPVVPLVHDMQLTAVNKRVQGFVPSPFTLLDFRSVKVAP